MSTLRYTYNTLSWALRALAFLHFTHVHIYEYTETRGESMLNTIASRGDFVHESKRYRLGRGVQMGDVVVMAKPTDPKARVCKRVSGMPGDVVLVDPSKSSELAYSPADQGPEGHVWVTGDNLNLSVDSRTLGCVPMGLIKGKIFAVSSSSHGLMGEDGQSFLNSRWVQNTFVDE
ncbi:uncharacterized protein CXQ87_001931 [Candidozyma duobushaemuli]|uniref:Mitochondrial inner membrane protease subunit n=1 Tax=Candidozyma duobushaemuli TaxID=1231522 RepID=A0A2V1A988_9ASCO|nr:uncharacterized protein CXQ87_001931 [[Candida] duobushaemulonis]PVH13813.1 hypothetical protein CXQ87_001931 [[Candida] duobushaemulonis]